MTKYQKSFNKALMLADALGIKVFYIKDLADSDGVFFPGRRHIYLEASLKAHTAVSILLHELGHVVDDLQAPYQANKALSVAYHAFYNDKANTTQQRLVLATEVKAWNIGERLATIHNISLHPKHKTYRKVSLSAYKGSKCA
jgi:Zn-dependent peptidase ImmA (M78 family)